MEATAGLRDRTFLIRVFSTYHPAAYLHAGKAGNTGPSKESILRCLRDDLKRLVSEEELLPLPGEGVVLSSKILAVDTEYRGRGNRELLTVGVSDGVGATVILDTNTNITGSTLKGTTAILLGHNIAEDIRLLWENGLLDKREEYVKGDLLIDTLNVARMAYEDRPSYKLDDLLASLYLVDGWKNATRGKDSVDDWSDAERTERCRLDAWATYLVAKSEFPKIDPTLYRFTQRVAMALHRFTVAGAFIDMDVLRSIGKDTEATKLKHAAVLNQAAALLGMEEFSPTNDNHIREMLFERLEIPPVEFTATEKLPSVTAFVLRTIGEANASHPVGKLVETLLAYSKADKLHSTYYASLVGSDDEPGLVYNLTPRLGWLPFNFNPLGARTGRRSSSDPNSQNWPKAVRRMVRSRWRGGKIVELDYRKLEPVIIAWLARDEKLLQFFTTGGGYIDIARTLFKTEVKEGTTLYRGVKSIVLGVHYDMQTDKMASQLWNQGIRFSEDYERHWEETDRIRHLYLDLFPKIPAYMDRRRAELRDRGSVRTPVGRLRRLGKSPNKHLDNQAINFPVQSTASEVTGAAILDVEACLLAEFNLSLPAWYDTLLEARNLYLTAALDSGIIPDIIEPGYRVPTLFNEVHDALLLDTPPEFEKRAIEIMVEQMRAVPTLRDMCAYLKHIPLNVDVKSGDTWGL